MNRKETSKSVGIGVGYITAMLIFAVICLTIFAVMSLKAAEADDILNSRSGEYVQQYYSADMKAKEILAELDGIAHSLGNSDTFAQSFDLSIADIWNISTEKSANGIMAEYSVPINETMDLFVRVEFYDTTNEFKILSWQTKSADTGNSEENLNVWDGNF